MSDFSQKTGKREFLLAGAVLLISALLFLWNHFFFSKPAAVVEISIDGAVTQTLDLWTFGFVSNPVTITLGTEPSPPPSSPPPPPPE